MKALLAIAAVLLVTIPASGQVLDGSLSLFVDGDAILQVADQVATRQGAGWIHVAVPDGDHQYTLHVTKANATTTTQGTVTAYNMTALAAAVAGLHARLAAIEARPTPTDVSQEVAAIQANVTALAPQVKALEAGVSALGKRHDELKTSVESLPRDTASKSDLATVQAGQAQIQATSAEGLAASQSSSRAAADAAAAISTAKTASTMGLALLVVCTVGLVLIYVRLRQLGAHVHGIGRRVGELESEQSRHAVALGDVLAQDDLSLDDFPTLEVVQENLEPRKEEPDEPVPEEVVVGVKRYV